MNIFLRLGLVFGLSVSSVLVFALTPHKSPNDDRQYQAYKLKNQLQVLLVSDKNSTKAAAALDVNVGSGSDPVDRQGLAHFLEHMLFLGTEKYPTSGEYQDFISAHGGGHNAYTSYDHTNYFFDIDAQYLEPALDRFAQFFSAPLFNAEFVGREINAVESEYRAKLKEDSRRSLDVFKSIVNQDHPFSKLSVGNVQTLLNDPSLLAADVAAGGGEFDARFAELRAELLKFYAHYYSASSMTLVVIGPQSLEQLKSMVSSRFELIPSGPHARHDVKAVSLFKPDFLPKKVSIQPEKDSRSLSITFPIPGVKQHFRSKPDQYLGNIIGHEGAGSLLSYLKAQGWAEALSAGAGLEHEGGATFNVSVSLTEAGLKHQQEIVAALFQLIQQIRDSGIEKWRQKEQKQILDTAFRFQEKGRLIGYASQLASKLHDYPAKEVLRGDYRLNRYKPRLIKSVLDHLRPENALVTTMAPGSEHELQSRWYSTPFTVSDVSAETLASWRDTKEIQSLKLPAMNPFLAEDLSLQKHDVRSDDKSAASTKPIKLSAADGNEVWWSPESQFAVPKAQLFFNIRSIKAGGTARNAALSQLLAAVVSDELNEYSYPALLAGINFQVLRHMRGLSIRVGGYSDKQALLLERIASVLKMDGLDEQRIKDLHAELLRRWKNEKKRLPYQQLFTELNHTLVDNTWSADQKAAALPEVSREQLVDYAEDFLRSATVQFLAVGNVDKKQAQSNAAIIASLVTCSATETCGPGPSRIAKLQDKALAANALKIDHGDSALIHYYQAENQSAQSRALMSVTAQLLKSSYFQQLRTQQQLGYVVFMTPMPILDVPGLGLIVQSPGHSVADIAAANVRFMEEAKAKFVNAEAANFKQHKAALLSELQEKPKNIAEQAETYWSDLALGYEQFSRRTDLITAVEKLEFDEWKRFFDSGLHRGLMIWSQGDRALGSEKLEKLSKPETGGQWFVVGAQ